MNNPNSNSTTTSTSKSEAVEQIVNAIEKEQARPKKFFDAWKKGVRLAGKHYFDIKTSIEDATTKWDLKPNYEIIKKSLHKISTGEALFLAAMYSFYDSEEGQTFLEELQTPNFSSIPNRLDDEHVQVLAELFVNYTGW